MRKGLFLFTSLFVILSLTGYLINKKISPQKKEETMAIKNEETVSLPPPKTSSQVSLEETISKRRSRRNFTDQSLTLKQISQILWVAQGITNKEKGFRSAPSAGALYPLEIYLVVAENGVRDLAVGVYHFNPQEFNLKRLLVDDLCQDLAAAALGQTAISQAPVNLVIVAIYERTTQKYGDRGKHYVHMEVGHVGQNIYLQAEALGLGTVTIGAFNNEQVKQVLELTKEEPLYIMPLGHYQ